MISLGDAEKAILDFPVSPSLDRVPLAEAAGRILAEDVFSPRDIPEFDRSAMDGYAYISGDPSASFRVVETIAAGTVPRAVIMPGQCAKVMTGAMLPAGANRVVRREYASEKNGVMRIVTEDGNLNVRRRGEDLQAGKLVLARGIRLRPAQVALLASLGSDSAAVGRRPRVGIITTGSELAEPGEELGRGQVYDSNSFSLSAQVREAGATPLILGRVADDEEATIKAIVAALDECDVLILSGGVSAGDFDYVPRAMENAGFIPLFAKVAVQPGMPTVFAARGEKCAFGLPGNPVSTFVIFEILIKPLLQRMMGHGELPPWLSAILTAEFTRSSAERTAFVPVVLRSGRAEILPYHGSAHLHSLARANGLMRVPAGQKVIAAGSSVDVRLL